jgi:hypothetical protein
MSLELLRLQSLAHTSGFRMSGKRGFEMRPSNMATQLASMFAIMVTWSLPDHTITKPNPWRQPRPTCLQFIQAK